MTASAVNHLIAFLEAVCHRTGCLANFYKDYLSIISLLVLSDWFILWWEVPCAQGVIKIQSTPLCLTQVGWEKKGFFLSPEELFGTKSRYEVITQLFSNKRDSHNFTFLLKEFYHIKKWDQSLSFSPTRKNWFRLYHCHGCPPPSPFPVNLHSDKYWFLP